jgi:sulfopyruvate decarboxylase subunit alpha
VRDETTRAIIEGLKEGGVNFVVYMPDAFFFDLINALEAEPAFECVSVPNESVGMCLCAGAWLGGKRPVMVMENTGLFVAMNAITRFHQPFGIPVLMLMSYRGDAGDGWWQVTDIGHAFEPVMKGLNVTYELVETPEQARKAVRLMETSAAVSEELQAVVFRKEGAW